MLGQVFLIIQKYLNVNRRISLGFTRRKSLRLSENEGAKFCLGVLTDIKNRGTEDILIACMDGLTGFPDAVKIEPLNFSLRKITRNKSGFPDDDSIYKVMY